MVFSTAEPFLPGTTATLTCSGGNVFYLPGQGYQATATITCTSSGWSGLPGPCVPPAASPPMPPPTSPPAPPSQICGDLTWYYNSQTLPSPLYNTNTVLNYCNSPPEQRSNLNCGLGIPGGPGYRVIVMCATGYVANSREGLSQVQHYRTTASCSDEGLGWVGWRGLPLPCTKLCNLLANPTCRKYPPVALTQATQTVSGQTYGNGQYIATASSSYPSITDAFRAFDTVRDTVWASSARLYVGRVINGVRDTYLSYNGSTQTNLSELHVLKGEWIQLQLPEPIYLDYYVVKPSKYSDDDIPVVMYVVGSMDGSSWTLVDVRKLQYPLIQEGSWSFMVLELHATLSLPTLRTLLHHIAWQIIACAPRLPPPPSPPPYKHRQHPHTAGRYWPLRSGVAMQYIRIVVEVVLYMQIGPIFEDYVDLSYGDGLPYGYGDGDGYNYGDGFGDGNRNRNSAVVVDELEVCLDCLLPICITAVLHHMLNKSSPDPHSSCRCMVQIAPRHSGPPVSIHLVLGRLSPSTSRSRSFQGLSPRSHVAALLDSMCRAKVTGPPSP
jgi:hypothetical protein